MYKFPGTSCIMSRNIASKKGQEIVDGRPRTSSRVVYRYVALDEISARCSREKFLKSTSARESFDQPSTSVPSAENDNGQSLLMNKFRRIIVFTRRLLLSRRRVVRVPSLAAVRKNALLTRVLYEKNTALFCVIYFDL